MAYYAIYYCAVAALYRAGGIGKRKDVPAGHEPVIQHNIRLAGSLDDEFRKGSATLLNGGRDMRADYFVGVDQEKKFGLGGANSEQAIKAAEAAARFLKAWTDKWTNV